MDDPVDRVFSHALSLVNKVRTGDTKPPSETRLELYGLYKQSMEGDVERIMDRPNGSTVQVQQAQEKWDAWKAQEGLSRTRAKCRYIDALISALNLYVEQPSRSRELVGELEFVWNQVKPNVPVNPPASVYSSSAMSLSNMSLDDDHGDGGNGSDREDEFVDAVDSTIERARDPFWTESDGLRQLDRSALFRDHDNLPGSLPAGSCHSDQDMTLHSPTTAIVKRPRSSRSNGGNRSSRRSSGSGDNRWRSRVEFALVQLTAEVAALREQLHIQRTALVADSYSFPSSLLSRLLPWSSVLGNTNRFAWLSRLMKWSTNLVWMAIKHAAINALIIGVVVTYLRRRALLSSTSMFGSVLPFSFDSIEGILSGGGSSGGGGGGRGLEDAIRVLIGDALAATVRHVHAVGRRPTQIGNGDSGDSSYGGFGAGKGAVFPSAVTMMGGSPGSSLSGSSGSCRSTCSTVSSSLSSAASLAEL